MDYESIARELDAIARKIEDGAPLCSPATDSKAEGVRVAAQTVRDIAARNTECKSVAEYDAKVLRKIEGMFEAVGPDLIDAIEALRHTECRSVDELAEAKRLIWKIRHICARPSGPSDLDRIIRLVDQYGATRSLEPGETTEEESKDGEG